jgi:hypothetical protein
MVVVLADQQPHLLTSVFDRSGKFAVLALKLGGSQVPCATITGACSRSRCLIGLSAETVTSSNTT